METKELLEKAIQINEKLVAKLKELEEPNLLGADGKYFTCEIDGVETKGRIRVEDIGVYLCQNEISGYNCQDKFGYKHSWTVSQGTKKDLIRKYVTNFKLWDYLPKEGEYFYVKTAKEYEFIAIAKNEENLTSRFVSLDTYDGRLNYDELGFVCSELFIEELRPATPQEITLLDARLKEDGKYFDKESMSIKDIEKELVKPTFKEGDWVLITKPKDVRQNPYWSYYMDKYDGQTLEIEEVNFNGYLVIDGWEFNSDWCTKVEVSESTFKVGDRCILWNEDKSDAVIGKLTKINYESDWPLRYRHCIKFESMKQYENFINE